MQFDLNKYKVFFFDFDGVITDSLHVKAKAFGDLFAEYGEDIRKQVVAYHLENGGVSRYEKFRYYYAQLLHREITEEIIQDLDQKFSNLVVDEVIQSPFVGGAMEFLQHLKEQGKTCFVVSGTPGKEIRMIVQKRGLGDFFKEVVGSPKKKKDNLRELLEKHHILSQEAIFFGDAKSDYEAAKACQMFFVGIENAKARELSDIKDICKIENFEGLLK